MEIWTNKICEIFNDALKSDHINAINKKNKFKLLRNKTNGITIQQAFEYLFLYSKKNLTYEFCASRINYLYDTEFSRQSFDKKSNNIPIETLEEIKNKLTDVIYSLSVNKCNKTIAIDGTNNNLSKGNRNLNLGLFDVTNSIPIDLIDCDTNIQSKEICELQKYIDNNPNAFKKSILVMDALYSKYDLLSFLVKNKIKFVIRIKNNLRLFNPSKKSKYGYDNDDMNKVRECTRIIKTSYKADKIVTNNKTKKVHEIEINSTCNLITNIPNIKNEEVFNIYKNRWEIENWFKLIKNTHKIQHIKIKDKEKRTKIYLCSVINALLMQIFRLLYEKFITISTKSKKNKIINKSHLMESILSHVIHHILNNTLSQKFEYLCKISIKYVKSPKGRQFPRISLTPFSKWYLKSYSNEACLVKTIDAITDGTVDDLHRNKKLMASKIKIKKTYDFK